MPFASSVVEGAGDKVGEDEGSGAKDGLVANDGSFRCCGVECWERSIGGTLYTLLISEIVSGQ